MQNKKSIIWTCMLLGSALGSYAPVLWGGSVFSFSSVILTAVGGALGIYFGFRINNLY